MRRNEQLEFVRLAGAELDDQAIVEIAGLLRDRLGEAELSPADLLRLAASGPLIVARRPCGVLPEIIGVAGLMFGPRALAEEIVAVNPEHADPALETALRACLQAQSPRVSLFRGRDRAPFGLAHAALG